MDDKSFVNTQMDTELDDKIRLAAAQLRITRSEFMRRAAVRFLELLAREKRIFDIKKGDE